MGRLEIAPDDLTAEAQIEALRQKATELGSNVIPLMNPGQPIVVYYGTNHDYQYEAPKLEPSRSV